MGHRSHAPVQRFQGPDRYSTAAQVALHTFGHADVAVLARGDDLGDAVASSYLAGAQRGGPILLTPQDGLPAVVLDALKSLRVKQVFIIGDATAVSGAVDTTLQSTGMRTTRLAGVTRYGTAGVIEQAGGAAAKLASYGPTALLVNSADLPDAIAAGPVSFHSRFPLLYTSADGIPAETVAALQEGGITHVVLVGSLDQIGTAVASRLSALNVSSERITGAGDPSSDSLAVAHFEQQTLHWPMTQIDLVRGDQGAIDGVATIAHAGIGAGPLLMTTSPDDLGSGVSGFLTQQAGKCAAPCGRRRPDHHYGRDRDSRREGVATREVAVARLGFADLPVAGRSRKRRETGGSCASRPRREQRSRSGRRRLCAIVRQAPKSGWRLRSRSPGS